MKNIILICLIGLIFFNGCLGATPAKRQLKYPHLTVISEYRHFESLVGMSTSRPLMVHFFLEEKTLNQFSLACGDKGGRASCLGIDLTSSAELASTIFKELFPQGTSHLYPAVFMWTQKQYQPSFRPDLTFESITYYFDRITGPALTTIASRSQLLAYLTTDKPLLLAYFPPSSHFIGDANYQLWQWYQGLARAMHHRLFFLELNDPELNDRPLLNPESPFLILHTDHRQPRAVPKALWQADIGVAAQWLAERSFGQAIKLHSHELDKHLQGADRRPLFSIWVNQHSVKNDKYTDMANILSSYYGRWMGFSVVALFDPSVEPSEDSVDVVPSSYGVLRANLPVATILFPQPEGPPFRYRFEGKLELDALKPWIDGFMKGELPPLVRSQVMLEGHTHDKNVLYLAHDYWNATVGSRGSSYSYLVVFWNSEFLDLAVPLMEIFYQAADLLIGKFHMQQIIVASYDLAKNDLPAGVEPPSNLVEPRLFISEPSLKVMSLPAGYVELDGEKLANWIIFRVLENKGMPDLAKDLHFNTPEGEEETEEIPLGSN